MLSIVHDDKNEIHNVSLKPPQNVAENSVFCHSGFTGKELDLETGYSYFGARYLDNALSTALLSVDPMSDKYPSISPYAYCSWNPVKLVDPDGRKIRGVRYNDKTQTYSYSKRAIKRGTDRYIEARIKTENGKIGIQELMKSKRRFKIKVIDKPLFEKNNDNSYSQLRGATIPDDFGMGTTIIVSTAEKNESDVNGYVVSDKKDIGEQYIKISDVTDENAIEIKELFEELGMIDFETKNPYISEEQKIHGIGAHEEEHALRDLDDERLEEKNALINEMKERLDYIKEVLHDNQGK